MNVSIEQLATAVDSTFVAHTAAGQIALTLLEARQLPQRGLPGQFRAPMTLILAGPADPILYDDLYYLDHPVLGRHQWFMTPISSMQAGAPGVMPARQRYQIIFA